MKYAYQMKAAKVIKLKERGIDDIRCRRSTAGYVVLEISVEESADKAEHLAIKWFIRGKRKRKFRPILHVDGS